jgi:hypothetical protein
MWHTNFLKLPQIMPQENADGNELKRINPESKKPVRFDYLGFAGL